MANKEQVCAYCNEKIEILVKANDKQYANQKFCSSQCCANFIEEQWEWDCNHE
jgi:hypothetical protein